MWLLVVSPFKWFVFTSKKWIVVNQGHHTSLLNLKDLHVTNGATQKENKIKTKMSKRKSIDKQKSFNYEVILAN